MKLGKYTPILSICLLLAAFFALSLLIRVALPYDKVFQGDQVNLTTNDAYYRMRLVDNWAHNFPSLTQFDPYFIYPEGTPVGGVHFFDWLIALAAWIIGLGAPTHHVVDVVGAYFPAVLAALTVIPAFFIGKALFNRWAGVLAAGLMAVLPGEYMGRSILGNSDTPAAEVLFSTVAVLFVILAVKTSRQRQLNISHLIQRQWKIILLPLLYSLLAGLFLGIYLITWYGAMLFVFIIMLFIIIQFIINHLLGKPTDHLGIVSFVIFLVALIVFLPNSPDKYLATASVVAVFIPLVLTGISRLITYRKLKRFYYPLALIGIGIVFLAIFYAVAPGIFRVLLDNFKFVFFPGGSTATTTDEMQSFLFPYGAFTPSWAWGNFTTSFFLTKYWPIPGFAFISFGILVWLYIKHRAEKEHHLLLFIWMLVILIATLIQRRFAYYLVVDIALLSAFLSWQVIWLAGLRKITAQPQEDSGAPKIDPGKHKVKTKPGESRGFTIYHLNTILAIIVVFVFVFFFNIAKSRDTASKVSHVTSEAWLECLYWMKDNTPEPLGDPDAYYKLYEIDFEYPDSAYGVTAWWDYGYWITSIAHRIPTSNPSQAPDPIKKTAALFLSQDHATCQKILEELGSAYVMVDYTTSLEKFRAIVNWAGEESGKYISLYYVVSDNQLIPVQVFNLDYYRTLMIRLYNFGGKAVVKVQPYVIAYDIKYAGDIEYRQVTDLKDFASYQEALDYISSQTAGNYSIIGTDPFISPIPLEAVPDLELVHGSSLSIELSDNSTIPEIMIYEYLK